MSEPENQTKEPLAVVISDIHYTVTNLRLCSSALLSAMKTASELKIPLIIAGDLNDSKAIIRAEVANELIDLFQWGIAHKVEIILIPGNHDLLSVKNNAHSLNFLSPYCRLVDEPHRLLKKVHGIPYQVSNEKFLEAVEDIPEGSIVIAHQGFKGANLGHYFKDDTSVDPEAVKHLKIISGHYHMHQTIGTVTYIGSPFTHTFGEANDGPKGFGIVYSDGSFEHVPLTLRKHIVLERNLSNVYDPIENYLVGDLLQLKVTGPYNDLDNLDKKVVGMKLIGSVDFKLDKIPTDRQHKVYKNEKAESWILLNEIIDNTDESDETKSALKKLWEGLLT